MKNLKLSLTLVLVLLVLVACTPSELATDDYLKTPSETNQILEEGSISDLQVLDVRTPEEFAAGCLASAQNIDFQSVDFVTQIELLDKEGSYLIYCRSGRRSADAVTQMREAGFSNLLELDGGISTWEAEGYEVNQDCGDYLL
ncbi:rhodanese-like domain-containing protein [Candidatus Peregrinibacteria bacterium]|jgi:rhodanese-related sulfurtransferase|nr:rhodanese-like domain-containing protein [Candidatus Peregrinibacteria bacterium]MBT7484297.1 rhodanese-like domain-containing protein [Candidatus Peregrinibacteria bacterium]MBT7703111.1 rhodanese-like domain-containing protein [Candidatus Peregrinibacteria bacterium]